MSNAASGAASKNKSESLGSVFSLCCRAGIDDALVKADFFFAGIPTVENKIEQNIQNTKVASAKVAFDTVRLFGRLRHIDVLRLGPEKMWNMQIKVMSSDDALASRILLP